MSVSFIDKTDKDEYVNKVYQIYNSDEYIRTLKESNYTEDEIKTFLKDIKNISSECFDNLNNQQSRLLKLVLNNDGHPLNSKVNLTDYNIKNEPLTYNEKDIPKQDSPDININMSNLKSQKYILSSLSQTDYNNTFSFSITD